MEEAIKNRVILILAVLTAIFFAGTVRSCTAERKLKSVSLELDKEKAAGWDVEQKMNEFKKEKSMLEKELEEAKEAYESNKKALFQEQLINESLKEELQKATKLKDALEESLKEALIETKAAKPKNRP